MTTIPIMTLDNQLKGLSIDGSGSLDPASRSAFQGKVPTLGDVKQSLRVRPCEYPYYKMAKSNVLIDYGTEYYIYNAYNGPSSK